MFEQPLTHGEDAVVLRKPVVTQCLEMCPLMVFDGIRLDGGRQDNKSVFSPPPGLTASLNENFNGVTLAK